MSLWKQYYLARDVEDALHRLAACAGKARVIAGGTDLLLDIQQGRQSGIDTLVDINQITEMNDVEMDGEMLSIGAATPLKRLVQNSLIREHAQALVEACGLVGGPQVRNVATVGGNVAHALPAGDGSIALLALNAQAEIASLAGKRMCAVGDLFLGPGKSAIQQNREILVRFLVPSQVKGQASAFRRVMRPQGVALPVLNMAVWIEVLKSEGGDKIGDIRIAIGPAGPVPFRAGATEAMLVGRRMSKAVIEEAKAVLLAEAHFRSSPQRGSSAYRQHLAEVLLEQTIEAAWERAGAK